MLLVLENIVMDLNNVMHMTRNDFFLPMRHNFPLHFFLNSSSSSKHLLTEGITNSWGVREAYVSHWAVSTMRTILDA